MAAFDVPWLGVGWGRTLGYPWGYGDPRLYGLCHMRDWHYRTEAPHYRTDAPLYATGFSKYGRGYYNDDSVPTGTVPFPTSAGVRAHWQGGGGERQQHLFRPPPGLGFELEEESEDQPDDVEITTMMVRNLPRRLALEKLVAAVEFSGFANDYDYVYMPPYYGRDDSRKQAYLNFRTPELAEMFRVQWHKSHRFGGTSKSVVTVSAADRQGFHANAAPWANRKQDPDSVLILGPLPTTSFAVAPSAEAPEAGAWPA